MPKKILIVEDAEDLRSALIVALTEEGFRVAAAERGEEAFDELASFHPDIVLLDMQLPGMSGVDILGRLRQEIDKPILMFTNSDDSGTVREALAAGATDYVLKETGLEELLERINKHLESHDTPVLTREPAHSPQKPLILYVGEDIEVNRLVTSVGIRLNAETTRVSTARVAMDRISQRKPRAVVTEMDLRDSKGMTFLKSLSTLGVPSIAVAGSASPEVRRSAGRYGAQAVFIKPVSDLEFEQALRKILGKKRNASAA